MGVSATFRIGFNWFNVSSSSLHFPLPPLFFGFFVKKSRSRWSFSSRNLHWHCTTPSPSHPLSECGTLNPVRLHAFHLTLDEAKRKWMIGGNVHHLCVCSWFSGGAHSGNIKRNQPFSSPVHLEMIIFTSSTHTYVHTHVSSHGSFFSGVTAFNQLRVLFLNF